MRKIQSYRVLFSDSSQVRTNGRFTFSHVKKRKKEKDLKQKDETLKEGTDMLYIESSHKRHERGNSKFYESRLLRLKAHMLLIEFVQCAPAAGATYPYKGGMDDSKKKKRRKIRGRSVVRKRTGRVEHSRI